MKFGKKMLAALRGGTLALSLLRARCGRCPVPAQKARVI